MHISNSAFYYLLDKIGEQRREGRERMHDVQELLRAIEEAIKDTLGVMMIKRIRF